MFYLLDKQKGVSSFKAISNFAKKNHIAKIGHAGTLDPLATGALLVATDDDTKLLRYITNKNKTYTVTFKIGYCSDTYDINGKLKKVSSKTENAHQVKKIIKKFQGQIKQTPPPFSAKKINGQKAYVLARQGILTNLKPVIINIFSIKNVKKIKDNTFTFKAEVSSGTYIRSLIHDIGIKLHSGAVMTALRRTKIGNLKLKKSIQKINPFKIIKLKKIVLLKKDLLMLLDGKTITTIKNDDLFLLVFKKHIIGVGKVQNHLLKSQKILSKKVQKVL